MPNPVRITLIPRTVDIDEDTLRQRTDTVQRMADLGQLDPSQGEIAITRQAWFTTVGDSEVEVLDYAVSPAEMGGQVVVTLVLAVDQVHVGETATPAQQAPSQVPTLDEKRNSGWGVSLGQQVAANAQANA